MILRFLKNLNLYFKINHQEIFFNDIYAFKQEFIVPPEETRHTHGQSEEGRLWDVLNVLRFAIKTASGCESEILFTVAFCMADGSLQDAQIKSICGPGDNGEPVLTIMLPNED